MKWPWFKKEVPVLNSLEGYNRWAQTYSAESNPIKDSSNKIIHQLLPSLKDKSVLDVGCGTGYFCGEAINRGAIRVVGTDFSEAMIAQARRYCPTAEYYHADITRLSFDSGSFDVIICALVLGHVKSVKSILLRLTDFLKTDGVLIISDFHPTLTEMKSKRTFQDATGKTFEIMHYLHPLQDTLNCLKSAGLSIEQLEEPVWKNVPVIYALRAKK